MDLTHVTSALKHYINTVAKNRLTNEQPSTGCPAIQSHKSSPLKDGALKKGRTGDIGYYLLCHRSAQENRELRIRTISRAMKATLAGVYGSWFMVPNPDSREIWSMEEDGSESSLQPTLTEKRSVVPDHVYVGIEEDLIVVQNPVKEKKPRVEMPPLNLSDGKLRKYKSTVQLEQRIGPSQYNMCEHKAAKSPWWKHFFVIKMDGLPTDLKKSLKNLAICKLCHSAASLRDDPDKLINFTVDVGVAKSTSKLSTHMHSYHEETYKMTISQIEASKQATMNVPIDEFVEKSESLPKNDSVLRLSKSRFRYLSAWFCPYAHRATLALEYHAAFIDYEWIEALGWEQRLDENQCTEWYYNWKAEELQRANPSALVPTLIPITNVEIPDESKAVYESLICMDYIDDVSRLNAQKIGANFVGLVPIQDPYLVAKCRLWMDKVNKECCSPYYGVLVRTDEAERKQQFDLLIQGLTSFSQELEKTSGPTFLSNGQISNVDLALIPWAYRFYVLGHYRGEGYRITIDRFPQLKAYMTWYQHVLSLDFVKRTLPDKVKYLEHITKYADATARSKVANAVRRGVAAHELEDDKDDVTR